MQPRFRPLGDILSRRTMIRLSGLGLTAFLAGGWRRRLPVAAASGEPAAALRCILFQNGGRQSMLTMKRDGHGGYIGSITLGVRR
jgi:hypothetical protein